MIFDVLRISFQTCFGEVKFSYSKQGVFFVTIKRLVGIVSRHITLSLCVAQYLNSITEIDRDSSNSGHVCYRAWLYKKYTIILLGLNAFERPFLCPDDSNTLYHIINFQKKFMPASLLEEFSK